MNPRPPPNYTEICVNSPFRSVECVEFPPPNQNKEFLSVRSRIFSGITYCPEYYFSEIVRTFSDLKNFWYILHDRDITEDGEIKEPHIHFVAQFNNAHTALSVIKVFDKVQALNTQNTLIEATKFLPSMLRYLIHEDFPNKYQYNLWEVKFFGNSAQFLLQKAISKESINYDWRTMALNMYLQNGDWLEVAQNYPSVIQYFTNFKKFVDTIKHNEKED